MNAKKIMGAVLVALLAAALFVGAGAAANGDTVFVYQKVAEAEYNGTWYNGANSVTFVDVDGTYVAIYGDNIVEGEYKKGDSSIVVKYPTGSIIGDGFYGGVNYTVLGATYYNLQNGELNLNTSSPNDVTPAGIIVTGTNGIPQNFSTLAEAINAVKAAKGTVKLQVYFDGSNFVADAPTNAIGVIAGKDVFTITVKQGADAGITAAADSVIMGNTVETIITGLPGVIYKVETPGFTIPNQTANMSADDLQETWITMPSSAKISLFMVAGTTAGDYTITVSNSSTVLAAEDATVDIEILEGAITAETDKDAYYIGNDVTITGTSTAGDKVYFYIAGTNKDFQPLNVDVSSNMAEVENGEFEVKVAGTFFDEDYDAGTYTVYVSSMPAGKVADLKTYTTVALVLKQPFVSITDAPSVAVKGTTYKVTGEAEAADDVYAYIFGTNFFAAENTSNDGFVGPNYLLGDNFIVKVKDNTFTVEVTIPQDNENMSAGQYFMVIQHPMYDKNFNVAPFGAAATAVTAATAVITMNSTDAATATSPVVVDVFGRQKANAAQALCDNLDSENVDDMYVKTAFVVAAPQYAINPIPETVAQGEKLTVSGSTNLGAGVTVTVEMLSTAFAAVPKATVGSASFISLVTKTDENGNWEITFDTTGLNVDEYTVSAAVEQLGTATAKVNVVEAAPSDEPSDEPADEPSDEPQDEPADAPETPGFGALAALAGLGAVAVLLLRRE